jgi:hypothetical protein
VRSLFLNDPGPQRRERLRVISRDPEYMIVRLVRTESLSQPEDWKLVTKRMPETWVEGFIGEMRFTDLELEYLQGKRELQ